MVPPRLPRGLGASGLLWVLLVLCAPRVLAIHCDPPPIVHGSQNWEFTLGEQLPLNSVLRYKCKKEYRLIGEAIMKCISMDGAGVWDKDPPICETYSRTARCHEPVVPGGYQDKRARPPYMHGNSVTFNCNVNFTMKGHRTVWCQANGMWGPSELPVCESDLPLECPALPALSHGQHTGEAAGGFAPGLVVNFSCQAGYLLVGARTIQCLSSGEWSAAMPHCEEAQCQHPGLFPHGRVNLLTNLKPGATLRFSCDEGYRLSGQPTSLCVVTEQQAIWTKMPVCEEILCPPLLPILHGQHSGTPGESSKFGSVVTYTCEPDPEPGVTFVLVGEPTLRCIADHQNQGIWNRPVPRCELSVPAVMCQPPQLPRGYISAGQKERYVYNDTVQFACEPSFMLRGSPKVRCMVQGSWYPAVPVCEKECPAPPQIPNGQKRDSSSVRFEPESSVNYSCNPGFKLVGPGTIHCSRDGLWMPEVPRCQEAECRPMGQRLFQRPQGHFIRKRVGSSCGEGFRLGNSIYQPCQGTEPWFVEERLCQEITCPPPPRIHNGTHSGSPWEEVPYGTTVTYSCHPGPEQGVEFALIGEPTLRCTSSSQARGIWSGPAPICKLLLPAVHCPPVYIVNGHMTPSQNVSYPYNSSVHLACAPGFSLKGSAHIRCGPAGAWDPEKPVCEQEEPCHPLEEVGENPPAGATVVLVNMSCQDGYRLKEFAYRKCEDPMQGVWFQRVPRCQALHCPPPPPIDNGTHSGSAAHTFPFGSQVSYVCLPGFQLQGEGNLRCDSPAEGQAATQATWSGPVPKCTRVVEVPQCPEPELRHGRLTSGPHTAYPLKSTVRVECDPGFVLNGSDVIVCQQDSMWAPGLPTCVKTALPDCPQPHLIPNGNHTGGDRAWFIPGTSILYSCNQGYLLNGATLLMCTEAGTWNQPFPSCIEVNCSSPTQVDGVQKGPEPGRTYQYGAIVTVECADGYTLEGSSQSQCEDQDGWNPPLAMCKSPGPLVPLILGLSGGIILLFCLVVVAFCMILKHRERNYDTNSSPKEDLHLETREVYSIDPYNPAS